MTAQKNATLFFQGITSESKSQKIEIPSLYRALKVQRDLRECKRADLNGV
mgnify:CR=1 FL=1